MGNPYDFFLCLLSLTSVFAWSSAYYRFETSVNQGVTTKKTYLTKSLVSLIYHMCMVMRQDLVILFPNRFYLEIWDRYHLDCRSTNMLLTKCRLVTADIVLHFSNLKLVSLPSNLL